MTEEMYFAQFVGDDIEETRVVEIPRADNHGDFAYSTIRVRLVWKCPKCGGSRGEVYPGLSFDGSRRAVVDCWVNPCGHIDYYGNVRKEAQGIATN